MEWWRAAIARAWLWLDNHGELSWDWIELKIKKKGGKKRSSNHFQETNIISIQRVIKQGTASNQSKRVSPVDCRVIWKQKKSTRKSSKEEKSQKRKDETKSSVRVVSHQVRGWNEWPAVVVVIRRRRRCSGRGRMASSTTTRSKRTGRTRHDPASRSVAIRDPQ